VISIIPMHFFISCDINNSHTLFPVISIIPTHFFFYFCEKFTDDRQQTTDAKWWQ
jgi:hypothetical protein